MTTIWKQVHSESDNHHNVTKKVLNSMVPFGNINIPVD